MNRRRKPTRRGPAVPFSELPPDLQARVKAEHNLTEAETRPDREGDFLQAWNLFTEGKIVPPIETQVVMPGRGFKFDFGFTPYKIGIEINGGIFKRAGGHSSVSGIMRDYEKARFAALAGWVYFPFDTATLSKRPGVCIDLVLALLYKRGFNPGEGMPG